MNERAEATLGKIQNMPKTPRVKKGKAFSLLDNSHNFLLEAIEKAVAAQEDARHWTFAILNLVQAVELSLKEFLRRQHPVLVYQDIDKPKHSVSITKALDRIKNATICAKPISTSEIDEIDSARTLRNEITHFEFELEEHDAAEKFFRTLAVLVRFQRQHLQIDVTEKLGEAWQKVVGIKKCLDELRAKALQQIKDEEIPDDAVMECPNCWHDTFVYREEPGECYLCRHKEDVAECLHCNRRFPVSFMLDFSDLFDWDLVEGQRVLSDNCGYAYDECCHYCYDEITEDITTKIAEKAACAVMDEIEREGGRTYRKYRVPPL